VWWHTANGGLLDLKGVICFEVEMRSHDRWVIEAWLPDGSTFELDGEYSSQRKAMDGTRRLVKKRNK
jgi:hypothetical protein